MFENDQIDSLRIDTVRRRVSASGDVEMDHPVQQDAELIKRVVTYTSEGLSVKALVAKRKDVRLGAGVNAVIICHGRVNPRKFARLHLHAPLVNYFARAGYLVFLPDYRGHGDSEGRPSPSSYVSANYSVDVLALTGHLEQFHVKKAFIVGQSMGAHVAARCVAVEPRLFSGFGTISGALGSYQVTYETAIVAYRNGEVEGLERPIYHFLQQAGLPEENPEVWKAIDPFYHMSAAWPALSIHHGTYDAVVPAERSELFYKKALEAGIEAQLFLYEGAGHNMRRRLKVALERIKSMFDARR